MYSQIVYRIYYRQVLVHFVGKIVFAVKNVVDKLFQESSTSFHSAGTRRSQRTRYLMDVFYVIQARPMNSDRSKPPIALLCTLIIIFFLYILFLNFIAVSTCVLTPLRAIYTFLLFTLFMSVVWIQVLRFQVK